MSFSWYNGLNFALLGLFWLSAVPALVEAVSSITTASGAPTEVLTFELHVDTTPSALVAGDVISVRFYNIYEDGGSSVPAALRGGSVTRCRLVSTQSQVPSFSLAPYSPGSPFDEMSITLNSPVEVNKVLGFRIKCSYTVNPRATNESMFKAEIVFPNGTFPQDISNSDFVTQLLSINTSPSGFQWLTNLGDHAKSFRIRGSTNANLGLSGSSLSVGIGSPTPRFSAVHGSITCSLEFAGFGAPLMTTVSNSLTGAVFRVANELAGLPSPAAFEFRCTAPWRDSAYFSPKYAGSVLLRLSFQLTIDGVDLPIAQAEGTLPSPLDAAASFGISAPTPVSAAVGPLGLVVLSLMRVEMIELVSREFLRAEGSYCTIAIAPRDDREIGPFITDLAVGPWLNLLETDACEYQPGRLLIYGGFSHANITLRVTYHIGGGLTLNGVDPSFAPYADFPLAAMSLTPTPLVLAADAANLVTTSYTPQSLYVSQRNFVLADDKSSVSNNYNSFKPGMPFISDADHQRPRVRPRYLHAATTTAPHKSSLHSYAGTAQMVFWFGGIALGEPAPYGTLRPSARLLSDLWAFDVLGNTTTLMYGDPALTDLPAQLHVAGPEQLVAGEYNPMLRPAARHSAALAYDRAAKVVWLYGGATQPPSERPEWTDSQSIFDDFWSFDLTLRQWAWWGGSVTPYTRDTLPVLIGNLYPGSYPPPLFGHSLVVSFGPLYMLFGNTMLRNEYMRDDSNPYFELDSVFRFTPSSKKWERRFGTVGFTSSLALTKQSVPAPGNPDAGAWPSARAYASVVHDSSSSNWTRIWVYGGVHGALRQDPSNPLSPLDGSANSVLHDTDSSVLHGLFYFNLNPEGWQLVDNPVITPAMRGLPRQIIATTDHAVTPGGRALAALNVDKDGVVWLYGGRGHAFGAHIVPSVRSQPVESPFAVPIDAKYGSLGETEARAYFAFVYTHAELLAAGFTDGMPLLDTDVLFTIGGYGQKLMSTVHAKFSVKMLLIPTSLSSLNSSIDGEWLRKQGTLSEEAARVSAVTFDARSLTQGALVNFAPLRQDTNRLGASSLVEALPNLIVWLQVDYQFSEKYSKTYLPCMGLAYGSATDGVLRGVAYFVGANASPADILAGGLLTRSTSVPFISFRSRLPPSLTMMPATSSSPFAAAQLDDLWSFDPREPAGSRKWRIRGGFSTPSDRFVSASSARQSSVVQWPGSRMHASLVIPTFTDAPADAFTTLYLHGGYRVDTTPEWDRQVQDGNSYGEDDSFDNYPKMIVYDDLWAIETASGCLDSTAPQSSVCSGGAPASDTSVSPFSNFENSLYPAFTASIKLSSPSVCDPGCDKCVRVAGGAYCQCNVFFLPTSGPSCNDTSAPALFRLFQQRFALALETTPPEGKYYPAFSAVAVNPADGSVWTFGGAGLGGAGLGDSLAIHNTLSVMRPALSTTNLVSSSGATQLEYQCTTTLAWCTIDDVPASKTPHTSASPPPSMDAVSWWDPTGTHMYLFAPSAASGAPAVWDYTPSTNTWAYARNFSVNYPTEAFRFVAGTYGEYADSYHPGAREGAATATHTDKMCLYSGSAVYYPASGDGTNTDVWCFDTSGDPVRHRRWARIAGESDVVLPRFPVFGRMGEFAAGFNPGARVAAGMAFSPDGKFLYLYGGSLHYAGTMSTTEFPSPAVMSDLWVFSFQSRHWAYLGGGTMWASDKSIYATSRAEALGRPSRLNYPAALLYPALAMDPSGLLYVGYGLNPYADTTHEGVTATEKRLFATLPEQLHNAEFDVSAFPWASDHVVGEEDIPWIALSGLSGNPVVSAWRFLSLDESGKVGARLLFVPIVRRDQSADYAVPPMLMARSSGITHVPPPVSTSPVTQYPYIAPAQFVQSFGRGVAFLSDACRVNPCKNGGSCFAADLDNNVAGVTDYYYHCACPIGFFGPNCGFTVTTVPVPSVEVACRGTQTTVSNSSDIPCLCVAGEEGVLCDPLRPATQLTPPSPTIAARSYAATAVVSALPPILARALGATAGATAVFFSGGAERTGNGNEYTVTGGIYVWLPVHRASVLIRSPSASGFSEVTNNLPGNHMGASLVYSATTNMLFLFGGLHLVSGGSRAAHAHLWRIAPLAESLGTPDLSYLTADNMTAANAASHVDGPLETSPVDALHQRRPAGRRVTGWPGARAYHSAAAVTVSGREWVYVHGGVRREADGTESYFSDLWRYPVDGQASWEYVGCATSSGYPGSPTVSVLGTAIPITEACPAARAHAQLVAVNGVLWLIGGLSMRGPLDDVWQFQPVSEAWTRVSGSHYQASSPQSLFTRTSGMTKAGYTSSSMGSRYGMSCSHVLRGGGTDSAIHCFGGQAVSHFTVDLYRRMRPRALKAMPSDTTTAGPVALLKNPFQTPTTTQMWTYFSPAVLAAAGLSAGMTISELEFHLERTPDARFSANVTISLAFYPDTIPDNLITLPDTDYTVNPPAVTITAADLTAKSGSRFRIVIASDAPVYDRGGIVLRFQTSGMSYGRELLAMVSSTVGPVSSFQPFSSPRSAATMLYNAYGTGVVTNLVPVTRFYTYRKYNGEALSTASSAAYFKISTMSSSRGQVQLLSGATDSIPSVASAVYSAFPGMGPDDSAAREPVRSDVLLEQLETGMLVVNSAAAVADAGDQVRLQTLPPLTGAVMIPSFDGSLAPSTVAFSVLGGLFTYEQQSSPDVKYSNMPLLLSPEAIFGVSANAAALTHANTAVRWMGKRADYLDTVTPEVPFPRPSDAHFTPEMNAVRITFNAPTQQPLATTAASRANCLLVLTAAGLGDNPQCSWASPTVFHILLGVSFTLRPSGSLTLRSGVVRVGSTLAEGEAPLYLPSTTVIVYPASPALSPVATVTGPSRASSCTPVTLSSLASTGNGGLAFRYDWLLMTGTPTEKAAIEALQPTAVDAAPYGSTSSPRYMPVLNFMGLLSPGEHKVRLTVTSWHGLPAQAVFTFNVETVPLPLIAIAGNKAITVTPARNVLVNAVITRVDTCDATNTRANITYSWQQISGPSVIFTGSLASLRIRAFTLAPSTDYVFRVSVSDTANTQVYNNSDAVTITVEHSPLRAALAGAGRSHDVNLPLVLSAAASRDPDLPAAAGVDPLAGLSFAWACATVATTDAPSIDCFDADVLPSAPSTTPELTVAPEFLAAAAAAGRTALVFTVTVAKAGRASVSLSGRVDVTGASPYIVAVSAPERSQLLQQNTIALTAHITHAPGAPPPRLLWSCDTRNALLDEPGLVAFTTATPFPVTAAGGGPAAAGVSTHVLALSGANLVPGLQYTLRLSLFEGTDADVPTQAQIADLPVGPLPGESTSAFVSFTVNPPPSGGVCVPAFADAAATAAVAGQPFTLRCSGWENGPVGLPLTYQWLAQSKRFLRGAAIVTWVEVGMPLPLSSLELTLSAGLVGDNYARDVTVVITDTYGAQARVLVSVPFKPPAPALVAAGTGVHAFAALAAAAVTAADVEALFASLDAAVVVSDIASIAQSALRVADALEAPPGSAASAITRVQAAAFRARLLRVLSNTAVALSVSQDARRAVSALDAAAPAPSETPAPDADPPAGGNQFLQTPGYSEVAIELLTQACGDGATLTTATRADALRFLAAQTASLASLDAFGGMTRDTAGTAVIALQAVLDSYKASMTAADMNAAMPNATDTSSSGSDSGSGSGLSGSENEAKLLDMVAEARSVANAVANQMNLVAFGAMGSQTVGQPADVVEFGGITVHSTPVALAALPPSVSAPAAGLGAGAEATVVFPPSLAARAPAGATALQLVMGIVEDASVLQMAGMRPGAYFNGSESSPLVAFTVFDRAMATAPVNVSLGGGLVIPMVPSLEFDTTAPTPAPHTASGSGSASARRFLGGLFTGLEVGEDEFFAVTIPHAAPAWPSVRFACEWWDADADGNGGVWSTEGCVLAATSEANTTTTCHCTHLTMFRVRIDYDDFLPRFNTLSARDFLNLTWSNIKAHPVPIITCLVWFVAYLIFAAAAAYVDQRKDRAALKHYHSEWLEPQREQYAMQFADGEDFKPYAHRKKADANTVGMTFTARWNDLSRYNLRHDHLWLSVIMRDDTHAFSSVGRLTAAFVLVLTGYMVNAIFFGNSGGTIGFSSIFISLISAAILVPVGFFISALFGRSQSGRLKDYIYGYAEHVCFLAFTGRYVEPEFVHCAEHQLKPNQAVTLAQVPALLEDVARAAGWSHGPMNVLVPPTARSVRDKVALHQNLRLLVHVDYDLFMVWYGRQWSVPRGLRLFGFVFLWVYVLVCVLLILVYGMQFDLVNDGSASAVTWLRSSAISNALEIFAFKPVTVIIKSFFLLLISFFCCGGRWSATSKATDDDNLTVVEAVELFTAASNCPGGVAASPRVAHGLVLDTADDPAKPGSYYPKRVGVSGAPYAEPYVLDAAGPYAGASPVVGDDFRSYSTLPLAATAGAGSLGSSGSSGFVGIEMTELSSPATTNRTTPPPAAAPHAVTADGYESVASAPNSPAPAHSSMSRLPLPIPPPAPTAPPSARAGPPPPPPLSANRVSDAAPPVYTATDAEDEDYDPSCPPIVPPLPAPSGAVAVMATRSTLAHHERLQSDAAARSRAATAAGSVPPPPPQSMRQPMPLPGHFAAEYHTVRSDGGGRGDNAGDEDRSHMHS